MNFRERSFEIIRQIPAGKVTYYGYVALLAGSPRAARQVGFALASLQSPEIKFAKTEYPIPWWRVVNKQGYLSIRGDNLNAKNLQKELLQSEGVEVDEEFKLDIKKYIWQS